MYRITIDMLCIDGYSEALLGAGNNTELLIESLVAPILLDLFRLVIVNHIRVSCQPATPTQQASCSLQIQIISPTEAIAVSAEFLGTLESKLESAICCALIELFSTILVERVTVDFVYQQKLDVVPAQMALDAKR